MTVPGGYVAGDVLTASNMNLLPAGVIGYAQITADSSSVTLVTVITGLEVSFTAVAGRRYRARWQGEITQSIAGDVYVCSIDDTVTGLTRNTATNGTTSSITRQMEYINNSSISGAKTWRVTLQRSSGSGNITISAGTDRPSFIVVEDIGPL